MTASSLKVRSLTLVAAMVALTGVALASPLTVPPLPSRPGVTMAASPLTVPPLPSRPACDNGRKPADCSAAAFKAPCDNGRKPADCSAAAFKAPCDNGRKPADRSAAALKAPCDNGRKPADRSAAALKAPCDNGCKPADCSTAALQAGCYCLASLYGIFGSPLCDLSRPPARLLKDMALAALNVGGRVELGISYINRRYGSGSNTHLPACQRPCLSNFSCLLPLSMLEPV